MAEGEGGTVELIEVRADETDLRLDRWFRQRYPALPFSRLARLLRTGQVRLDGRRAQPGERVRAGQQVRVPPLVAEQRPKLATEGRSAARAPDARAAAALRAAVLHRDDYVIALNKPAGLAVQGGTGTHRHLDAMLDALRFDAAERPRLVHRLDKDTSGVLLLARNALAARALTEVFRRGQARKTYWALVAGVPRPHRGRIDLALGKRPGAGREKVTPDHADGRAAATAYAVIDAAAGRAAWVALRPLTGRTHQLRVHMAAIGAPILGDGKYGGAAAFIAGLGKRLHLHAWAIAFPRPDGREMRVEAPPPAEMIEDLARLGFDRAEGERALRGGLGRALEAL